MEYVVRKEKQEALKKRMEELGIKKADIEEKFVRSGGHGGQNVNKTATCVQLKHLPTQITVKCQKSRSQSLNRFLAMRLLVEKLEKEKARALRKSLRESREAVNEAIDDLPGEDRGYENPA